MILPYLKLLLFEYFDKSFDLLVSEPKLVESALVDSKLVEPVLVESALVEPVLVESALVESTLVEPVLVESALVESTLVEPVLVESAVMGVLECEFDVAIDCCTSVALVGLVVIA